MKKKRYIKLLMSEGFSRNDARRKAAVVRRFNQIAARHRRNPAAYQTIRDNPICWMVWQMFNKEE